MTAGEESPGGSSQDGRTNEKCSLCFYEVKMTTQAGGNPVDCMTRERGRQQRWRMPGLMPSRTNGAVLWDTRGGSYFFSAKTVVWGEIMPSGYSSPT